MNSFLEEIGANPGRSGHRLSQQAARTVYDAREAIAALFRAPDPLRVVFTANVTEALNLAIRGYLRPGDHVVTSSMEHNSVMRPLRAMANAGPGSAIELSIVPCSEQGLLDPAHLRAFLRPSTRMIVLNHASNVCGSLLPVRAVGALARRHNCLLLVDAAQTAGSYPIDVDRDQIDLLAFTGHKSLGGPTGTGGLLFGERVDVEQFSPLIHGGTGSRSEHEAQPDFLPDKFESGTANAVGLAGLATGVRWIMAGGVDTIRHHEMELTQQLVDGLQSIPGVTVHGPRDARQQVATISFNIDGRPPSEVGLWLDDEYDIMCRVGLHCAPAAHRTLGTFPSGTVRFSLGAFNTRHEVDTAISAVQELARS
jgi:cysteine desulfurase family protein